MMTSKQKLLRITLAASVSAFLFGCGSNPTSSSQAAAARLSKLQASRTLIAAVNTHANVLDSTCFVVVRNGLELVTESGAVGGITSTSYLGTIDGIIADGLFYGKDTVNVKTPKVVTDSLKTFLAIAKTSGKFIGVVDYCTSTPKIDSSYVWANWLHYVAYQAPGFSLAVLPTYPSPSSRNIMGFNTNNVTTLAGVKNISVLLKPAQTYVSGYDYNTAITATNYDLVVMDGFFADSVLLGGDFGFTEAKAMGGVRLRIAYINIAAAEKGRYYWKSAWNTTRPSWMSAEDPLRPGRYPVDVSNAEWQKIICGAVTATDTSYVQRMIKRGFDGVCLDISGAY